MIGGFDYLVNAEHFHMLVEKYTGLKNPKQRYVSMDMMKAFGWQEDALTIEYMEKLNNTLEFYGITNKMSIMMFIATCGHESGKGKLKLERLNSDGTTVGNYQPYERGAGYIQITWRDTHLEFLESVNDPFIEQNTAEYIAQNHPWEAAAWYWAKNPANLRSSLRLWPNITLNEFATELGDSLSTFLLIQYAVNGWASGTPTNESAGRIMNGTQWRIENGLIFIEGEINNFKSPIGWTDRERNYHEAVNLFK